MTTPEQRLTQTMLCRQGCGRHVHYGVNPDGTGYIGTFVTSSAWEPITTEHGRIRWTEHACGNLPEPPQTATLFAPYLTDTALTEKPSKKGPAA